MESVCSDEDCLARCTSYAVGDLVQKAEPWQLWDRGISKWPAKLDFPIACQIHRKPFVTHRNGLHYQSANKEEINA